jgi:cytoskeletal protein RodZ
MKDEQVRRKKSSHVMTITLVIILMGAFMVGLFLFMYMRKNNANTKGESFTQKTAAKMAALNKKYASASVSATPTSITPTYTPTRARYTARGPYSYGEARRLPPFITPAPPQGKILLQKTVASSGKYTPRGAYSLRH